METVKINENIFLHYIDMKKLKTNVAGIYIRRPLCEKEASMNAVLANVLKNGCEKFPKALKISQHLQGLYGATLSSGILKRGDSQVICFDAETISDKYAPDGEKLTKELLNLLLNVIFKPLSDNSAFKTDIVEREKKNIENKIDALINDKRSYAQLRCTEIMCENDAFSITRYGTKKAVSTIDEKNLFTHYENIISSSQIDIFVSGDANTDELKTVISEFIKDITFKPATVCENTLIKQADSVKNITEKLDVTQGKLSIGFTTGINALHPDYPALTVANSIFGAGTHSKLFNNVREKLSLAYYASSSINKFKGLMFVDAGIEFDNFEKAYNETLLQFDALSKGEISDDELTFSKSTLINSLNSYYDDQRCMQLYALDCIYLNQDFDIEKDKANIENVTKDDILKVVKNISQNTVYFLTGK